MAFGFLGDIVEEIGEVILPRGTRGATIGGALGGPVGAVGGAIASQALSQATGKSAVSAPTASQAPKFAPESTMSGEYVYRPYSQRTSFAEMPGQVGRGIQVADTVLDIVYPQITNFFGGNGGCEEKLKPLVTMRRKCDGTMCPTMSRKQQATARQMIQVLGIDEVAAIAGVSTSTFARLVFERKPAKKRGISGAALNNAKRTMRTINRMHDEMSAAYGKTTTRRRTTTSRGTRVTNIKN